MFKWHLSALACTALLAACATQESTKPTAAAAATPTAAPSGGLTEDKIMAAQAQGYKIVNEDGKTLLCRRELPTGSRARHRTSCMTAEEWEQVSDNSKQALQDMARQRPQPRGN